MNLRDNYYKIPGRVASCDATPMPSNAEPIINTEQLSFGNTSKISDDAIKRITENVIAKLNK